MSTTLEARPVALSTDYTPTDSAFGRPFIDIDEWHEGPRRHRYVHGGFEGGQTLFSFYFPEKQHYRGRFVQWLEGGAGGSEKMLSSASAAGAPVESVPFGLEWFFDMGFDDLGAYLVESNQGHLPMQGGLGMEDDIKLWRASAESARFSRFLAEQIYGQAPHHGYVGGASGGGIRSISCIENAPDVWAGGVPEVCTFNPSIAWTAQARATLILGEDVAKVIDATDPGGSGNPFEGLTALQRDALADLYRVGWPRGCERQLRPASHWAFQFTSMEASDPSYFDDFWMKPGYVGADTPELLTPYLIRRKAVVKRVLSVADVMPATMRQFFLLPAEMPFGLELDVDDHAKLFMANIYVRSGQATGRDLLINGTLAGVSAFGERTPELMQGIQAGDEVEIDNSRWLAFCHYYRYAARSIDAYRLNGGPEFVRGGARFVIDGAPMFPQRKPVSPVGRDLPLERQGHRGDFETKMILIGATRDVWVWPTQVCDYVDLVRARHGERARDKFRVYWVENATHGPPAIMGAILSNEGPRVWEARLVDYLSTAVRQSFRYVKEWVEEGTAPPADTNYEFSVDSALVLDPDPATRCGVQPVVSLTVNGGKLAEVKVGQNVDLVGRVIAPPLGGPVVSAEWSFDEDDYVATNQPLGATTAEITASHSYDKPGVHFITFRAGSHRDGTARAGSPVHNLDRVRVVVRSGR